MVHHQTLIRFIAPVVATGLLAFGSRTIAAEADVTVASAAPRVANRTPTPLTPAPAAPAPRVAPQAGPENALPQWGQVSGTAVNVRTGPGIDHSIVATLKGGEYIQIATEDSKDAKGEKAGWLKIAWPEHSAVWIAKEGVQTHAAGAGANGEQTATVKVPAPVRATATRKADPLCKLDSGAKVVVLEEQNGWLKIKPPAELHAYISAKYVTTGVRKPEAAMPPAANAVATDKIEKVEMPVAASAPAKAVTEPAKTAAAPAKIVVDDKQKEAEQKQKLADATHDKELETERLKVEAGIRAHQEELNKIAEAKRQQEEQARIAAEESKHKAEEEQRKIAEAKHQQELELARAAAENRRKAVGSRQ